MEPEELGGVLLRLRRLLLLAVGRRSPPPPPPRAPPRRQRTGGSVGGSVFGALGVGGRGRVGGVGGGGRLGGAVGGGRRLGVAAGRRGLAALLRRRRSSSAAGSAGRSPRPTSGGGLVGVGLGRVARQRAVHLAALVGLHRRRVHDELGFTCPPLFALSSRSRKSWRSSPPRASKARGHAPRPSQTFFLIHASSGPRTILRTERLRSTFTQPRQQLNGRAEARGTRAPAPAWRPRHPGVRRRACESDSPRGSSRSSPGTTRRARARRGSRRGTTARRRSRPARSLGQHGLGDHREHRLRTPSIDARSTSFPSDPGPSQRAERGAEGGPRDDRRPHQHDRPRAEPAPLHHSAAAHRLGRLARKTPSTKLSIDDASPPLGQDADHKRLGHRVDENAQPIMIAAVLPRPCRRSLMIAPGAPAGSSQRPASPPLHLLRSPPSPPPTARHLRPAAPRRRRPRHSLRSHERGPPRPRSAARARPRGRRGDGRRGRRRSRSAAAPRPGRSSRRRSSPPASASPRARRPSTTASPSSASPRPPPPPPAPPPDA